jgi:hypothetical protein
MRVIGDKVLLTDYENEAVLQDLKSLATTTIIAEEIGDIWLQYSEIESSKVTLNRSRVHGLKTPCMYWWYLGLLLEFHLTSLGGWNGESYLDSVQKLSLDSLTWELIQLKLPQAKSSFPCFKNDTQVYLVIEKTLYSFTPLQVKPIKTLFEIWCYSSHYSRGTLYHELGSLSLAVGELTSL